MSNPHIFKTELFTTYLYGVFGESKVKSIDTDDGKRIIVKSNILISFNVDYDDEDILDRDYDDFVDESDTKLVHLIKMNELIGKIASQLETEYGKVSIQKWWDCETSITISDSLTVFCNFKTSVCRIINTNPHLSKNLFKMFDITEENIDQIVKYSRVCDSINKRIEEQYVILIDNFKVAATSMIEKELNHESEQQHT